jgi:hypothetical protein
MLDPELREITRTVREIFPVIREVSPVNGMLGPALRVIIPAVGEIARGVWEIIQSMIIKNSKIIFVNFWISRLLKPIIFVGTLIPILSAGEPFNIPFINLIKTD